MLEELILFGRETADPWNRVTCCKRPVLLLIEFCQVRPFVRRVSSLVCQKKLDSGA